MKKAKVHKAPWWATIKAIFDGIYEAQRRGLRARGKK